MKYKGVFMISAIIIIIALIGMAINWFVSPFSDSSIRVLGGIMLLDLPVLTFSSVKLICNSK